VKTFDAGKTRMIGEKNYDDMLSHLHTIPACYGQTEMDGQTELLTRDKNGWSTDAEVTGVSIFILES